MIMWFGVDTTSWGVTISKYWANKIQNCNIIARLWYRISTWLRNTAIKIQLPTSATEVFRHKLVILWC